MESFGKILTAAREEKSLSFETIERETAILKQYLEGLENEQLDIFPGETYATGFLRNYAEYLGLDPNHLLKLYHAKVLQESPPPADLLKIRKSHWFTAGIVILCVIAFALVVFFSVWGIKTLYEKRNSGKKEVPFAKREASTYVLNKDPEEYKVFKGDILKVPSSTGEVGLKISSTLTYLVLETPIGTQIIELGEELPLDVNGDSVEDVSIYLSDISKKTEALGATIRTMLKDSSEQAEEVKEDEILQSEQIALNGKQTVLFEGKRAYPFSITANFRGACLFRYKSDRKDSIEDFFTNGDTLTTTSNNSIRIWMSNANTVKIQVTGDGKNADIEMGKAGQVMVQDIRWIKEPDGTYKLVVLEVD